MLAFQGDDDGPVWQHYFAQLISDYHILSCPQELQLVHTEIMTFMSCIDSEIFFYTASFRLLQQRSVLMLKKSQLQSSLNSLELTKT